ncbi:MAG TPA: hypothetical protein VG892_11980, partial [Terriglobales bacterium]|nr:hypothetical protein [Terriglobales bacterium]
MQKNDTNVVTTLKVADCVEQISKFAGDNLASRIALLEARFSRLDRTEIVEILKAESISEDLLNAAKT